MLGKLKRFLSEVRDSLVTQAKLMENIRDILQSERITAIRERERYDDPRCLMRYGRKAYSQSDEDGFIQEIFRRIGTTNKTFVEFGAADGLENNTLALLFADWSGLWIEGSTEFVSRIRRNYFSFIDQGRLSVIREFITKENIDDLISTVISEKEIDLISVDIDGNDYAVFDAILCVSPRVVVIEYNAKFFPPMMFCMNYDSSHTWNSDDSAGASLKFLEVNMAKKGYCLVGCNLAGVNAFFVRSDLVGDHFLEPFTAEQHYEPARYYLGAYASGHRAHYDALVKSMAVRADENK